MRSEISSGWDSVRNRLQTLSDRPSHEYFVQQGISAYTVKVGVEDYKKIPAVLERCLRAASNMEEQLKHSTHLFFFKTPEIFIGISDYLPPLISVLIPIFLAACTFDSTNFRSRALGISSFIGTIVCVSLALLRPEIAIFLNPAVAIVTTFFLVTIGNFINS
ncbi:hypothetical protein C9890_0050 [Perkinsus sp. BL_2016]|nr:hypothetical protein C9890_0050 [Perkinsus sp. BL_2016]